MADESLAQPCWGLGLFLCSGGALAEGKCSSLGSSSVIHPVKVSRPEMSAGK